MSARRFRLPGAGMGAVTELCSMASVICAFVSSPSCRSHAADNGTSIAEKAIASLSTCARISCTSCAVSAISIRFASLGELPVLVHQRKVEVQVPSKRGIAKGESRGTALAPKERPRALGVGGHLDLASTARGTSVKATCAGEGRIGVQRARGAQLLQASLVHDVRDHRARHDGRDDAHDWLGGGL